MEEEEGISTFALGSSSTSPRKEILVTLRRIQKSGYEKRWLSGDFARVDVFGMVYFSVTFFIPAAPTLCIEKFTAN